MAAPSVLFWGMDGPFSAEPLSALLNARISVQAVIMPAADHNEALRSLPAPPQPASDLPLANPYLNPSIVELAHLHRIPLFSVGRLAATEVAELTAGLQPDVSCVACFPRRIPVSLLALPRWGFLNLHPSLLPDYRGPAPLFWIFQRGETRTGVTVHFMDADLDTGDIARQAPVALPDGISGPQADRLLGRLGGRLLVETVKALVNGTQKRNAQPPGGDHFPMPGATDFRLQTDWSARRAFNFMRGTAEWAQSYEVIVAGKTVDLIAANSFEPSGQLGQPIQRENGQAKIQFSPGILSALLA